jgi:hypothetical protein
MRAYALYVLGFAVSIMYNPVASFAQAAQPKIDVLGVQLGVPNSVAIGKTNGHCRGIINVLGLLEPNVSVCDGPGESLFIIYETQNLTPQVVHTIEYVFCAADENTALSAIQQSYSVPDMSFGQPYEYGGHYRISMQGPPAATNLFVCQSGFHFALFISDEAIIKKDNDASPPVPAPHF